MGKRVSTRKRHRVNKKNTRRTANKHFKKAPIVLDQAVAKHWDKKLTVRQNYQKLGLALSGDKISNTPKMVKMPELEEGWTELSPEELSEKLGPDYAVVERNEEGEIIDILMGAEPKQPAPAKKQTPLVKELSQKAQQVKLVGRHLSRGEIAWIEALIAKHGDDYEAMFRDAKLNIYQQTVGQLRSKCQKYLLLFTSYNVFSFFNSLKNHCIVMKNAAVITNKAKTTPLITTHTVVSERNTMKIKSH